MHEQDSIEAQIARVSARAGEVAFRDGFADRVMSRLAAAPSLADGLQRTFWRITPLAAAAALVLAVANVVATRDAPLSLAERVLALPATTASSAAPAGSGLVSELVYWENR